MNVDRAVHALRTLRNREHQYVSTACRHGHHEQCVSGLDLYECRWCNATCLCPCHLGATDARTSRPT